VTPPRARFRVAPCRDLEEFTAAVLAIGQYFGMEATEERMARFSRILPVQRMLAAREGGETVGGAGAIPFELGVPGGSVPTAGVTVVGTSPTHRRRGVLRSLMRALLDDAHARGEPLAALWASEETIYGRYGFGIAAFAGEMELRREHVALASPLKPEGSVRLVGPAEAARLFPRVYDRVRRITPGMPSRSREWWELRTLRDAPPEARDGAGPKRLVVLERNGSAEAYAIYRHKPKWDQGLSAAELSVLEAIGLDGPPTAELWRYLLEIDWYATLTFDLLPPDHPLFFLLAEPRRMRYRMGDGLWVRLLDVGEALSRRRYAADGALVVDVADPFCPWNEGRWRVADGIAKRTRAAAQIRCDVSSLGSAYLGGATFSQLVRSGRVEELRRGAAARADAMFATDRHPWCPEIF
jgi:predicted acetyltransferase